MCPVAPRHAYICTPASCCSMAPPVLSSNSNSAAAADCLASCLERHPWGCGGRVRGAWRNIELLAGRGGQEGRVYVPVHVLQVRRPESVTPRAC